MKSDSDFAKKDNVIVSQGHLYLFWCTGVYYTAELAEKFNVILVVPEQYKANEQFQLACQKLDIATIVYYQFCDNSFAKHRLVARQFRELVLRYQPVTIVQHDYIGIENMYLFHYSKKIVPQCANVVVLSSKASTVNTKGILEQFLELTVDRFARRVKLPKPLLKGLIKMGKYGQSFIQNYLLPSLVLKVKPYFPLSRFSNIDCIPYKPLFDSFLVYDPCEQAYLHSLFAKSKWKPDIAQVQFPTEQLDVLNDFLYAEKESKQVVLLPSLMGIRSFEAEKENLDQWAESILELKRQLPEYQFVIKFHPGHKQENIVKLIDFFRKHCGFLKFAEQSAIAERLILQSELIVGDVSTTLWWGLFYGGKVVVSFDMKNFCASSDMREFSQVLYIDQLDKLKQTDLNTLLANRGRQLEKIGCPKIVEYIELMK